MTLRVLVIGSGGREHAIALALRGDPSVDYVACAPGNAGTQAIAESFPVDVLDGAAVADLARAENVDLVVVGPEAPLVAGVADAVRAHGIACYGPSADAARLEGSKAFAKDVMAAAGVPTARSHVCETREQAEAALAEFGAPYVVKDDGLAAGKGVVVTDDLDQALNHADACTRVVVEEYLDGPEVSLFCICDGTTVLPMRPAQDFKRVGDDDAGPNTGGMGAYTPLPWLADELTAQIVDTVARPTVQEMARRGTPFTGTLFIGLAMTAAGPKVIEFNARFGDPETQPLLALLETPLGGLLHAAAQGRLAEHPPLRWRDGSAVTVVLAAANYPDTPRTGDVITGSEQDGVIHAGTRRDADGRVRTAGGRVLGVTATGATLADARNAAYALTDTVHFAGEHHRRDIAARAAAGQTTVPGRTAVPGQT